MGTLAMTYLCVNVCGSVRSRAFHDFRQSMNAMSVYETDSESSTKTAKKISRR